MFDLPSLRRQYGSVFVTNLDNGDVIPWKQLNVGEFLEYSILIENGVYAKATLEDEIFKKCVLDEYVVDSLPALKAGTVSTVVQDILSNSGPGNISELNSTLNVFRSVASQALHQTAAFICQAFPAYKLEDVYGIDIMRDNVDICKKRLGGGCIVMGNTLHPKKRLEGQTETEFCFMNENF